MKSASVSLLMLSALLLLFSPVSAQVCGDVDDNGQLTLMDYVDMIDYLTSKKPIDSIVSQANADCDGYAGITVGDYWEIVDAVFWNLEPPAGCPATQTYTYPVAVEDTVFLPRWENVPASVNQIVAPVITKFSRAAQAMYFAIEEDAGAYFSIDSLDRAKFHIEYYKSTGGSTDTLFGVGWRTLPNGGISGVQYEPVLMATRQISGVGDFAPVMVDRSPDIRVSIVCDGIVYVPVIVYYDYRPELQVNPTSTELFAYTGEASGDGMNISFTSDPEDQPVEFTLTADAEWIVLGGYTEPMMTPAVVHVTANAAALQPGNYDGVIDIAATQPNAATIPVSQIQVSLAVRDHMVRPAGDLDCDGMLTLGDLVMMIYYMFINPGPIPPCE